MKKINVMMVGLITLIYALTIGLGNTCFLNVASMCMGIALDGKSVVEQYPRFFPFYIIVGIASLVVLIIEILLNIRLADRLEYSRFKLYAQIIASLVLSIPMMVIWMQLFEHLHKVF